MAFCFFSLLAVSITTGCLSQNEAEPKSQSPQSDSSAKKVETSRKATEPVGLQKGDEVSAWEPIHLTGPEAGTKNCPVCTHLERPAILVFAKWNDNTEELAFMLNQFVQEKMLDELKAFVVVTDGDQEAIKEYAEFNTLANVSICTLDEKTRSDDLKKYKIEPKNNNTIVVYRDFVVWSNHVDLKSTDFEKLEDSVSALMDQPRKKVSSEVVKSATAGKKSTVTKPNSYAINAESAKVSFIGSSGDSTQDGNFEQVTGTINCPTDNATDISFEIQIDMNSIKTEFDLLTKHLKSDEFFDVEKFPVSKFVSKSIAQSDQDNQFTITGDMTVHGVTNELSIPAEIQLTKDQVAINAKFIIAQSKFGMQKEADQILDEVPVTAAINVARKAED